jgi:rare lipoprotein A
MTSLASIWRTAAMSGAAATLAACASLQPQPLESTSASALPPGSKTGQPYQVNGRLYTPHEQPDYDQVGLASWYGDAFNMRPTANGEIFDMDGVSAAHTTLPLPSIVEVTNLDNGRKLKVRVNDRGPFVDGRIIDLSHEAARELGFDRQGLANVRVRYIGPAEPLGAGAGLRMASAPRAASAPGASVQMASTAPAQPVRPAATSDIVMTSLPAPVSATRMQILPSMPTKAAPLTVAAATPPAAPRAAAYRIQAGAFSAQANAERAVSQLSGVGQAMIEPMQRNGVTLYRVMLMGPADELQAFGLRDRVAAAGFEDALVVRPF